MIRRTLLLVALSTLVLAAGASSASAGGGATTANGWYEGEEIYYILSGVEQGVTQRGENDLYLIGGDRAYQGNVAEFIPGEAGYTPHWNVNVVHTAPGVTLADILASPYASAHYPEALFDDVEDILGAEAAGSPLCIPAWSSSARSSRRREQRRLGIPSSRRTSRRSPIPSREP